MSASDCCPAPTLKPGETLFGFRVERVQSVPEIRAVAYVIRHEATGAQVLHLHCEDPENLYAITFRTPPPDSTGVPHILEHSVLAGSQRYPLKDVFNELSRGSLATFINAFTAPDFTTYPVCSQVRADFYNLASVYTDLTLRPLITKSTFMREGHHLQPTDEGDLRISGIVYNEMKGAFSTAERISQSTTQRALFPDNAYGVESGGLPTDVPRLTYEEFRDFHRRYYSPTNARVLFYGDLPTRDHLEFLSGQLEGFGAIDVDSAVKPQPRWSAPRQAAAEYPVGSDDPTEKRTTVNIAWLTAPSEDMEQRLILEVLEEALVGNPAAPLRKAMIDSGLGEDLSPLTGLGNWYKELPFFVGLRNTDPQKAEEIETLALDTLRSIAQEGLKRELLEAAIHQVEFKGLEITRRPMPFSINLLFRTLTAWLHDNDPLMPLTFPTLMADLRRKWESDPGLFDRAIQTWLVENPHRLRAVITPSRTLAAEREAALKAELADRRATMTPAELDEIRSAAEALREEQQKKTTSEDLAKLPHLEITDIPREVEPIPSEERAVGGVRILEHDLYTNGIAYIDVAFDVSDVPEALQSYLPMLGGAATGMGAAGLDYEAFATRKALLTGGITHELSADQSLAGPGTVQMLTLRGRALQRNAASLVALVSDILVSGDLADTARLKDILSEHRNGLRAAVAPGGHRFGWRTAGSSLSDAGWRDEQWHGAFQLLRLGEWLKAFDDDPMALASQLAELRKRVFRRGRVVINLTGDRAILDALRRPIDELIAALPEGGHVDQPVPVKRPSPEPLGIAIPGEVSYVARVLPVPRYTEPAAPLLWAISSRLGKGYFYKKVRIDGGAYGGMCVYGPIAGQIAMLSYRDPHLKATLDVYAGAIDHFLDEEISDEELRTTIIGAVGKLDPPLDPATKGREALRRMLIGLTDDDRMRFREGVLSSNVEAMKACVRDVLPAAFERSTTAVYGPAERIEKANAELPVPFTITPID